MVYIHMKNLRKYGNRPFNVAVIHGGPGAAGEMATVARELSLTTGVLEPLQTADSIDGQLKELYTVLKQNADLPVIIIGFSWGAMLSFIFAAQCPSFIKKLILVGSPPFEEKYASGIIETSLNRLNEKKKREVIELMEALSKPSSEEKTCSCAGSES